jgi:hypothetical protein
MSSDRTLRPKAEAQDRKEKDVPEQPPGMFFDRTRMQRGIARLKAFALAALLSPQGIESGGRRPGKTAQGRSASMPAEPIRRHCNDRRKN